jgi:hypothetical protein
LDRADGEDQAGTQYSSDWVRIDGAFNDSTLIQDGTGGAQVEIPEHDPGALGPPDPGVEHGFPAGGAA